MTKKLFRDRRTDQASVARDEAEGQRPLVIRISISLSEELLQELDLMVGDRGFASRSQAVSTILHRSLTEHRHKIGDRVMVGTITLFYYTIISSRTCNKSLPICRDATSTK